MPNVQPLLTGCNGLCDLNVSDCPETNSVALMLGIAYIECFPRDADSLQYKMAIGRLYNLGFPLRAIGRKFGHDHRTVVSWGKGLTELDLAVFTRIYSGPGAMRKVTDAMIHFIQVRYRALKGAAHDFRDQIRGEVKAQFDRKLSGEVLRRIFRMADAAAAKSTVPALKAEADPQTVEVTETPRVEAATEQIEDPLLVPMPAAACPLAAAAPQESQPLLLASAGPPAASTEPLVAMAAMCPDMPPEDAVSPAPGCEGKEGDGCEESVESSLILPLSRNHSPTPLGLPLSGRRPGSRQVMCHHAGQLLFAPWMDQLDEGRPSGCEIQRQWLGQVLQGAPNLEQAKVISGADLAIFTGGQANSIATQRGKLALQAAMPELFDWLMQSNARIVPDGPGKNDVFYLDPHTKEYTGDLDYLKGWCGRIHGIAKVLHLDFIHSESGLPVWLSHHDNYFDLRTRVFFVLDRFEALVAPGQRKKITTVVDRGIFGLDTFQEYIDRGHGLISWEKGYAGGAWREDGVTELFELVRTRNNSTDTRTYRFEAQQTTWQRHAEIRRFIVRATNPDGRSIEVSVLCVNSGMDMQRAVLLIFKRWLQENDFKMLDRHYGLMELTSRRSESYAELAGSLTDQSVDSLEYRALKTQVHELERLQKKALWHRENVLDALAVMARAILADREERGCVLLKMEAILSVLKASAKTSPRLLIKIGELAARAEALNRSLSKAARGKPKLEARQALLQAEISGRKETLQALSDSLAVVERDDSRLRLLISAHYRRPDIRAKAVMDAIRVSAHNLFANLMREFRGHYDNLRDDAVVLRNITRAPGLLRWDGDTIEVGLWLCGEPEPAVARAIDSFLGQMTRRINAHFSGSACPVKIFLLNHAPGW